MIEQLKTIREALKIEDFICTHGADAPAHITEALTALAQLEAMVWKPVAWCVGHSGVLHFFSKREAAEAERVEAQRFSDDPIEPIRPLVFGDVAPVARQTQAEVLTDEQRLGWYAWRVKDLEEKLANAQKQPQAKPHKPLFADLIAQQPGLREALLEMDKQPQAECRSDGRCQYAIDHGAEGLGHCPEGKCAMKQPQAEVAEVFYCKTCGTAMQMPHDDCLACERGERQQPQAEAAQACGHSMSLLLRSAESNEPLYCEACDDKSGRHDAERRETELLDANRRLQEKIGSADALKLHAIEELCQLGYTVKDGELFPPDHLHKLMEAANHPLCGKQTEAVPSSALNPDESDSVTLWAEIWRLREAVKGPDGYATWQDAATAERIRRVRAESKQAEASALIERMADALRSCSGVPHWPSFQPLINEASKWKVEAVPPTHVLVPVEPTEAMMDAAVQAICYGPEGGFTRISGPQRAWKAMIDAAIAQQKGGV